jgi:RNA polymerase sigma-70 factor (ECF subfamily)
MLTPISKTDQDRAASVLSRGAPALTAPGHKASAVQTGRDAESVAWLGRLRSDGPQRDQALGELRELLLRAARFEVNRRRAFTPHVLGGDHEDLAQQSADDALVAILSKLDRFRGESRFTTWAYKFALFEAGVKLRRRAWQGREVSLVPEHWALISDDRASPDEAAETSELLQAVRTAIDQELTPHQREILIALTINDIPIDVLAERLNTSRGALYKTLHDARRKLRAHLSQQGLGVRFLEGSDAR